MPAHTAHLKATTSTPDSVRRPLVLILFTIFLDVLGLGLIIPVAPFYARAFSADALQVGLLFTAFVVMQFLTTPILGALSDRFGVDRCCASACSAKRAGMCS